MRARRLIALVALLCACFAAERADAYGVLGGKWWPSDMPLGWSMDTTTDVVSIPGDDEYDETRRAFRNWDQDPYAALAFSETGAA